MLIRGGDQSSPEFARDSVLFGEYLVRGIRSTHQIFGFFKIEPIWSTKSKFHFGFWSYFDLVLTFVVSGLSSVSKNQWKKNWIKLDFGLKSFSLIMLNIVKPKDISSTMMYSTPNYENSGF